MLIFTNQESGRMSEDYGSPFSSLRVNISEVMMNIPGKQLTEAPMRDIFYIKYSLHHYKYTPQVSQQQYIHVRKGEGVSVNYVKISAGEIM